jgi:phosphatidylserine synthase
MAHHVEFLREPLFHIANHTIRVVHVASYICSFLGVFWLSLTYSRWRATEPRRIQWRNSLFIGALVFPITAIHHLMNTFVGLCLVGLLCLSLILLAVLRIAKPAKTTC